ncbi:MAG: hypothetical protein HY719_16180 [Planctomycetes bacterium]|nr:hypothetical protein [Planctomycetota bacterium]
MVPDSLRTRGVLFAVVFGPPVNLSRALATAIFNAVCDQLSMDLTLKYAAPAPHAPQGSKGEVVLSHQDGRRGLEVRVTSAPDGIRLVINSEWPEETLDEDIAPRADKVAEAVYQLARPEIQKTGGDLVKGAMSTRIRAQVLTPQADAMAFLRQHLVRVPAGWEEATGRKVNLASVRLMLPPRAPGAEAGKGEGSPAPAPACQAAIEVLAEDPRALYLEISESWSDVRPVVTETGQVLPGNFQLTPMELKPSECLGSTHQSLTQLVKTLFQQ